MDRGSRGEFPVFKTGTGLKLIMIRLGLGLEWGKKFWRGRRRCSPPPPPQKFFLTPVLLPNKSCLKKAIECPAFSPLRLGTYAQRGTVQNIFQHCVASNVVNTQQHFSSAFASVPVMPVLLIHVCLSNLCVCLSVQTVYISVYHSLQVNGNIKRQAMKMANLSSMWAQRFPRRNFSELKSG